MAEEPEVCTKISDKVKMAGFLEKKGSMLWKRYWFVLEDKLLLYYKSQLEYINLSPCRGSVNMALVSTVQPRRNSRENVINIVSRYNNLVLKAKDRPTQEKWLRALLDSIGKQGLTTFKYSLENIRVETEFISSTLPRRPYGGSLDAVWKQPVIPKTKMLDKVLGFEEEPDENQNLHRDYEEKSLTLDSRMSESKLNKFRNALTRRKSGPDEKKPRKDSFLRKMFRRNSSVSTEENKPVEKPDSDIDDPLYDKIKPASDKPVFGSQLLLPAGAMAELKDRLRSKESLSDEKVPPALPPRHSGSFDVDVSVHSKPDEAEESEVSGSYQLTRNPEVETSDSETSGHYQKIKKSVESSGTLSEAKPINPEVEYQVVNKEMKKKNREKQFPQTQIEDNVVSAFPLQIDTQLSESQVSEEKDESNRISAQDQVSEIQEEVSENTSNESQRRQDPSTSDSSGVKNCEETSSKEPDANLATECNDEEASSNEEPLIEKESPTSQDSCRDALIGSVPPNSEESSKNWVDSNERKYSLTEPEEFPRNWSFHNEDTMDVRSEKKLEADKTNMGENFANLATLLASLALTTNAQLIPVQQVEEDPDYDIPRPHASIVSEDDDSDRIPCTAFFNQPLSSGLEPDSLEGKESA